MTVAIETSSDGMMIRVYIEKKLTFDAIAESIDMAKQEIAKKIWEENQDKIMAGMDLKGLANLVAIYASKRLAEDIRK